VTIEKFQSAIPSGWLAGINWSAAVTGLAYFFTTIVPAIVGLLSAFWLGLQIYIAFKTKPWRKK
jgi:hypothetical protein